MPGSRGEPWQEQQIYQSDDTDGSDVGPLTLLTGIVLGSSAAITIGLTVVVFLFLLLAGDYPRLASEMRPLAATAGVFAVLTAVCAFSFFGLVKKRPWRLWIQPALWAAVAGAGYFLVVILPG